MLLTVANGHLPVMCACHVVSMQLLLSNLKQTCGSTNQASSSAQAAGQPQAAGQQQQHEQTPGRGVGGTQHDAEQPQDEGTSWFGGPQLQQWSWPPSSEAAAAAAQAAEWCAAQHGSSVRSFVVDADAGADSALSSYSRTAAQYIEQGSLFLSNHLPDVQQHCDEDTDVVSSYNQHAAEMSRLGPLFTGFLQTINNSIASVQQQLGHVQTGVEHLGQGMNVLLYKAERLDQHSVKLLESSYATLGSNVALQTKLDAMHQELGVLSTDLAILKAQQAAGSSHAAKKGKHAKHQRDAKGTSATAAMQQQHSSAHLGTAQPMDASTDAAGQSTVAASSGTQGPAAEQQEYKTWPGIPTTLTGEYHN
jgi:hypothetical protein